VPELWHGPKRQASIQRGLPCDKHARQLQLKLASMNAARHIDEGIDAGSQPGRKNILTQSMRGQQCGPPACHSARAHGRGCPPWGWTRACRRQDASEGQWSIHSGGCPPTAPACCPGCPEPRGPISARKDICFRVLMYECRSGAIATSAIPSPPMAGSLRDGPQDHNQVP
jgi:hypothetical protein